MDVICNIQVGTAVVLKLPLVQYLFLSVVTLGRLMQKQTFHFPCPSQTLVVMDNSRNQALQFYMYTVYIMMQVCFDNIHVLYSTVSKLS